MRSWHHHAGYHAVTLPHFPRQQITPSQLQRAYKSHDRETTAKPPAPGNYGTFAPKNFRSRERKYHGIELSLPGTFVPWNFRSRERKFQELSLLGTFAPGSKIPRTFTPTPSDFGRYIRSLICMHTQLRQSFNFCCTKALYHRQRPHNHHFQHTTLVSLTAKLSWLMCKITVGYRFDDCYFYR